MTRTVTAVLLITALAHIGAFTRAEAQDIQLPGVKACNAQYVGGKMLGSIGSRKDATHTGNFEVTIDVQCENGRASVRNLEIHAGNLTDTAFKGEMIRANGLVELTSLGKAAEPTVFLTGSCKSSDGQIQGCRFWMMVVANNRQETPVIVSFVVVDAAGKRLVYGTGVVPGGDAYIKDEE